MPVFLEKVTRYLISKWDSELADICIVLPNRRSGLFLRKYLAGSVGKTIWSPQIFSIEDFAASVSGLRQLDQVQLLSELYEVHKELEGKKSKSFEDFIDWAPQLITDFNEVDRNMTDARQLFSCLDEAKAIALWNPEQKNLTDFEKEYLHFYNSLFLYYQKLVSRLLENKTATQGLLFRTTASTIEKSWKDLPWKNILFAGFNALTKAEEHIIRFLYKNGKADILWDADQYYLGDDQQEAGGFLRRWFKTWDIREPKWISDDFREGEKNIEIVGVANNVGQAKLCGEILAGLRKQGKLKENTAVVLPDERMLFPMLNSIPSEIHDMNITMGIPLRHTPLAGLLDSVFLLHLNAEKFTRNRDGKITKYYFRDVLNVLQHPYIRQMAAVSVKGNDFIFQELLTALKNAEKIFISKEEVTHPGNDVFSSGMNFLESAFEYWDGPGDALKYLQKLIEWIRDSCLLETDAEIKGSFRLELEYLYQFSTILRQLKLITETKDIIRTNVALFRLFRQMTESTTLPFYGEPLKGIQLMGMLETRTLDFENLIILSCNEDVLPHNKHSNSYIPFDIKREFGIPTFRDKDAVAAYHFYRLLQRAKKIWLIYNTEADELGGGDKSRFLRQIIHELPVYNPGIRIRERIMVSSPGTIPSGKAISVPKTIPVMKLLEEKAKKGFSPTSLNAFRKCPLSFYFSEIAGIREPEVPGETIDPKTLGQAVHLALNNLYKPFPGKEVTLQDISQMKSDASGVLDQAFRKIFPGPDVHYGKNLLLVGVAKKMVLRYLRRENEFLEELINQGKSLKIVDLEKYIEHTLEIERDGMLFPVKLKGIIDRVDLTDCLYRIIDYKTGSVEARQLEFKSWEELLSEPDMDKVFQLLIYSLLLNSKKQYRDFPIRAGIISLKKIGNGFMEIRLPAEQTGAGQPGLDVKYIEQFTGIIKDLIGSIFDKDKPFDQTAEPLNCTYCSYVNVCGC